jgi:16S rRNA (guanine966-N2)-methyltransferase
MRIIAGKLGGRVFNAPSGNRTHPMSDKVRGALFNSLGDVTGLTMLDCFAGSGAIGFEALSRGAYEATLIDADRQAQATIATNIQILGLGVSAKQIRASAAAWLSTTSERFAIVVCDPPYDQLQSSLIVRLADRVLQDGLLVLSLPPESTLELPADFELLTRKNYGDATLSFYRRQP